MKHIVVFGSLRKNSKRGYNFNRFGGQKYIKDIELDGYEMYDLEYYPAICQGSGKVKAELHSVEDGAYKNICSMEKGAGYSELSIDVDGIAATLYVKSKQELSEYPKYDSGDWN